MHVPYCCLYLSPAHARSSTVVPQFLHWHLQWYNDGNIILVFAYIMLQHCVFVDLSLKQYIIITRIALGCRLFLKVLVRKRYFCLLQWSVWTHKWLLAIQYKCFGKHLTEWDVKEPLRTTSSLAVTTVSVLISECILNNYRLHAGRCSYGLRLWIERPRVWVSAPRCGAASLGKALHLYVHSFDPGMNGYLVGQWLVVCLNSFSAAMAAGLYVPKQLHWYYSRLIP